MEEWKTKLTVLFWVLLPMALALAIRWADAVMSR